MDIKIGSNMSLKSNPPALYFLYSNNNIGGLMIIECNPMRTQMLNFPRKNMFGEKEIIIIIITMKIEAIFP